MKKVLIFLLVILLSTGCMRIDDANLDELTTSILASKSIVYNHNNSGFKYYLPKNLKSIKRDEFNEVLKDKYYEYYLYVDLVAYYNKSEVEYKIIENSYYSKLLVKDSYRGVINVTQNGDKFLVSVHYNYASVQVVVNEGDINLAVSNALIVASTVKYNDDVIKKLLESNDFSSIDEIVNIFEQTHEDSGTLGTIEDEYTGEDKKDIYDPDVIR